MSGVSLDKPDPDEPTLTDRIPASDIIEAHRALDRLERKVDKLEAKLRSRASLYDMIERVAVSALIVGAALALVLITGNALWAIVGVVLLYSWL